MRSFKLSKRQSDWVIIGVWDCKFDPSTKMCGCCSPKHMVPPGVLKHPNKEVRELFRQLDSNGKSRTPRRR